MSKGYWIAGGYVSRYGVANTEGHSGTPLGESFIKNTGHFAGGTGPPVGGAHDNESAAVRRNY